MNNTEFIRQLKNGNEKAFDAIYNKYYSALCAFASQYILAADSEEVVQETMLWVWENRSELSEEMSLKSLLFTAVKNKCLNNIKHLRIRQEVHSKIYNKLSGRFEDPDFYLEAELLQLLDKAIKELPADYRQAFELNRFHNYTYDEIAQQAGVTNKTIAYRISQALKLLRKSLKDYLPILLILFLSLDIFSRSKTFAVCRPDDSCQVYLP